MSIIVNTNINALTAQRNQGINNSALSKALERLSSGLRINSAADDAAGLAIATKMGAQANGLNQAVRNSNNAISLVQTAEGGVNTMTNILQRLRELAVQASSDDNTSSDRATLTSEATNLLAEFTRTATTSQFNTMNLLDGSFTGKNFQVGANYSQTVTFSIADTRAKSLGGRAEFTGHIADGVINAYNANFGAGEFKINNYGVAATSQSDDQYSVIDLSSGQIASANLTVTSLASLNGIGNATSAGVKLASILSNIIVNGGVSTFASLNALAAVASFTGTGTQITASLYSAIASLVSQDVITNTLASAFSLFLAANSASTTIAQYATVASVSAWIGSNWGLVNTNYASAIYSILQSILATSATITSFGSINQASYFDSTAHATIVGAGNVTSWGQLTTSWFNGGNALSGGNTVLADTNTVAVNVGATVSYGLMLTVNGVALSIAFNTKIENSFGDSGLAFAYNSNFNMTSVTSAVVTGASLAAGIAAAITNNASLAALGIVARTVNTSGWVIEGTGGVNLQVLASLYVGVDRLTSATDSAVAVVTNSALFSLFGAQDLVSGVTSLIGNGGDLTTTTVPTAYNGESSAIAKAVAINAVQTQSGVSATAKTNTVTGDAAVGAGTIANGDIYINGQNIGAVTVTDADSTGALVTAINNQTTTTGVVATKDTNNKLVLSAADGRNIAITVNTAAEGSTILGLGTAHNGTTYTYRSSLQLNDPQGFSITGNLADLYAGSSSTTKTTDTNKSAAADVSTYNVAGLRLDTQANAESAILTIDSAMNGLNNIRATIGAVQDRLQFTVSNLQIASENMTASRSAIQDTDFAAEVASMTKNQVLVQAGTAMITQANTISQYALQLLR